jgi:phosphohistidine phosphatase SixA
MPVERSPEPPRSEALNQQGEAEIPRRAVALGLPLLPFLAARPFQAVAPPAAPQTAKKAFSATAILFRHAEKSAEGDPKDPPLSEAGRTRAEGIAHLLSRSRATHLFASEFKRTQETLAPLAEATKLSVVVVPGGKTAELALKLLALPAGSVAVVAGHSNTIPALATLLGGTILGTEATAQGPMLPDSEYGRIFVLTPGIEEGRCSVLELST